jgi:hypothetical protein
MLPTAEQKQQAEEAFRKAAATFNLPKTQADLARMVGGIVRESLAQRRASRLLMPPQIVR